jgi:hypothetical protein
VNPLIPPSKAWQARPGAEVRKDLAYVRLTHPTYPESSSGYKPSEQLAAAHQAMLREWNDALRTLHPLAHPDVPGKLRLFDEQAAPPTEPVPERDLPAGCPSFMRSVTTWALRSGRTEEDKRATITVTVPAKERPWHKPGRGTTR